MTPQEADDLADRIMRAWPKMLIPPDEWRDVLRSLDAGTAGTAFIRLRNTEKYPPTIADFLDTYRSLPTQANQPIRTLCTTCGGDGFASFTQWINDHEYTVVKGCHCANGPNAQRQADEAEAFSRQQRERMFPHKYPRSAA